MPFKVNFVFFVCRHIDIGRRWCYSTAVISFCLVAINFTTTYFITKCYDYIYLSRCLWWKCSRSLFARHFCPSCEQQQGPLATNVGHYSLSLWACNMVYTLSIRMKSNLSHNNTPPKSGNWKSVSLICYYAHSLFLMESSWWIFQRSARILFFSPTSTHGSITHETGRTKELFSVHSIQACIQTKEISDKSRTRLAAVCL